jgi:hypothetical protein
MLITVIRRRAGALGARPPGLRVWPRVPGAPATTGFSRSGLELR